MANPFQHPAMNDLLERVSSLLESSPIWLLGHNQLIFVCGGPTSAGVTSVRKRFLEWARFNIQGFRFFRAEAVAEDILANGEPRFLNLSQFEKGLADVADCVIVIPESVGSWAEAGLFSALPKIRAKCLVINDVAQQGSSFLNTGPLQSINDDSVFRPTFHVDFEQEQINFAVAADRIRQYSRANRKRLEIEDFDKLTGHEQFAVVHYLTTIFPSLTVDELVGVIRKMFSKWRKQKIERIVSILIAVKYFDRMAGEQARFFALPNVAPLLEIENVNRAELLAESLSLFEKHAPDLIPNLEQQDAA